MLISGAWMVSRSTGPGKVLPTTGLSAMRQTVMVILILVWTMSLVHVEYCTNVQCKSDLVSTCLLSGPSLGMRELCWQKTHWNCDSVLRVNQANPDLQYGAVITPTISSFQSSCLVISVKLKNAGYMSRKKRRQSLVFFGNSQSCWGWCEPGHPKQLTPLYLYTPFSFTMQGWVFAK